MPDNAEHNASAEPERAGAASRSGEDAPSSSASSHHVLDQLWRTLGRLRRVGGATATRNAATLSQVEREFWEEVNRSQQEASLGDGYPVFVELQTWRRLSDLLGLSDALQTADRLLDRHARREADTWRTCIEGAIEQADNEYCFQQLLQTTRLQLMVWSHCGQTATDLTAFDTARQLLRTQFVQCLESEQPDTAQLERWNADVIDHVDTLLASIDHVTPDRAANELTLVTDDVQWHIDQVEACCGTRDRRRKRRLKKRLRRLKAEYQERDLQYRLENRFGHRLVAATERLVLVLIFLVVGLMVFEMSGEWSEKTILWLNTIDTAACVVFLTELGVKLWFVRGKWRWFWRHFLIDFVPSIPVGLFTHGLTAVSEAEFTRSFRLARFLRLSRLARYVRILRPLIRVLRGLGLLARGLDRLARRYGHILNRTVILHPTREELNRVRPASTVHWPLIRKIRNELRSRWRQLLQEAPLDDRVQIARQRFRILEAALTTASVPIVASTSETKPADGEIPIGALIEAMRIVTPEEIDATLGAELMHHLARVIRILVHPPFRWVPIFGHCMPRISGQMTDGEIVTAASHQTAAVLKRLHNAWLWLADLYGTVTPSQFVDRVGTMLVNSSSRPAIRLIMFGGLYLLLLLLLQLVSVETLEPVKQFLERYVGPTVMLVGSLCFIILALGWWLRHIAREATEFYEQSAQAQFLALTETFRSRNLVRDTQILYDRVLRPEWHLAESRGLGNMTFDDAGVTGASQPVGTRRATHLECFRARVRESLVDTYEIPDVIFQSLETTILLYRDWLDGAIFTDNDTRATSQLLGSPAVRQFLNHSGRISHQQIKMIQRLDLQHNRALFSGPYLWFNFISRSITYAVASLVVDYSQHAVPLDEQEGLDAATRERYGVWLACQESALAQSGRSQSSQGAAELSYVTNAFTTLHFLDYSAQRDHEIESRFGTRVVDKLKRDRSLMIRRIFGSLPLYERERDQRVVNLYGLYSAWLADGRAFLAPWYLIVAAGVAVKHFLRWMAASVREIRRPELRQQRQDAARSHFRSAVRKIDRIRGPVARASTYLRMCLDPEYLGVPLPGQDVCDLEDVGVNADVKFLQPEPALIEAVEESRQRAAADMMRLQTLIDNGLLERVAAHRGISADRLTTQEHRRATAVAYLADLFRVRRFLSARDILDEAYRAAAARPLPLDRCRPRPILQRKFKRYWSQHGFGGDRERVAAWAATARNIDDTAYALIVWAKYGDSAREQGERILGDLLMHPGRVTDQLVTIRVIQTLAVLDVLSYREHVYRLGQYADMGDQPGELLEWDTTLPE